MVEAVAKPARTRNRTRSATTKGKTGLAAPAALTGPGITRPSADLPLAIGNVFTLDKNGLATIHIGRSLGNQIVRTVMISYSS